MSPASEMPLENGLQVGVGPSAARHCAAPSHRLHHLG